MTDSEKARIQTLIERHRELIEECGQQLATNYEIPAPRIIGIYCHKMGITREDWEKITAVCNGWEYEPVPAHILARQAAY